MRFLIIAITSFCFFSFVACGGEYFDHPSNTPQQGKTDEIKQGDSFFWDCRTESYVEGSDIVSIDGKTTVTTEKKETGRLIEYYGSVYRIYSDDFDQLKVIHQQDNWSTQDFMAVFFRPLHGNWEQLIIPIQTIAQEKPYLMGLHGSIDLFHWFEVKVGNGIPHPEIEFTGVSSLHSPDHGTVNMSKMTNKPMTIRFSQLPQLKNLIGHPLEWAVMGGISVKTWLPLDGLAGDYSYTLQFICPTNGCTARTETPYCSIPEYVDLH